MPPHSPAASDPAALARSIEDFLADHPRAALLEDGRLLFDLRVARCSVTADRGRCLLHLWSDDRNLVRTVSAVQPRRDALRLETRRFGQSRPQVLTLVPDPDFRTPTARDTARRRYLRTLEQALGTHFPDWAPEAFRSAMDLEKSFGPAWARGILARGQSAWAVLGAGPDEPPSVLEGALTLGILWLDHCRRHAAGRRVFHGLRLILPRGIAAVTTLTAARIAWLSPAAAQWELWELDPGSGALTPAAAASDGNLDLQLPHAFDPQAALERSAAAIGHLSSLLPPGLLDFTEIRPRGATEIAFSLHGLDYACIRRSLIPGTFTQQDQIFFGAAPHETLLDEATEDLFRDLAQRLFYSRYPAAQARDALFRLQPERWLESVLRRDLSVLGPDFQGLESQAPESQAPDFQAPESHAPSDMPSAAPSAAVSSPVYSQLLAFASASRTLLDLLTVTRQGHLAVLELKADDDLHLPLQALDYWARVRLAHREGRLTRLGYFPGIELSPEDPLLLLVAPALHIHPANETVLQYLAPAVPWQLIGLDERWREHCRVLLRKRSAPEQHSGGQPLS